MGRGRTWAAAMAVLALVAPLSVAAQTGAAAPQYVTYTEEVPCPPSDVARRGRAAVRRRPHRHVPRRVHRAPVHRVTVRKAPVKPRHIARAAVVHPRHRPLVRASDPVGTKRCSVVRRDRLTAASFGLTPESAVLTPVGDDVAPGGPGIAQPSSGRAAFGDPVNPAAGGGDPGVGGGQPVGSAPEPDAWALMLLGVGLAGARLRRRRPLAGVS